MDLHKLHRIQDNIDTTKIAGFEDGGVYWTVRKEDGDDLFVFNGDQKKIYSKKVLERRGIKFDMQKRKSPDMSNRAPRKMTEKQYEAACKRAASEINLEPTGNDEDIDISHDIVMDIAPNVITDQIEEYIKENYGIYKHFDIIEQFATGIENYLE